MRPTTNQQIRRHVWRAMRHIELAATSANRSLQIRRAKQHLTSAMSHLYDDDATVITGVVTCVLEEIR